MAMVGLATGITAAAGMTSASAATANGAAGWYSLCSHGTYRSVGAYANSGGAETFIANPGECVPVYLDGTRAVDIYGEYPDGTHFHVGTDWYPSNLATEGDMGPGDYYFIQF